MHPGKDAPFLPQFLASKEGVRLVHGCEFGTTSGLTRPRSQKSRQSLGATYTRVNTATLRLRTNAEYAQNLCNFLHIFPQAADKLGYELRSPLQKLHVLDFVSSRK